MTNQADCITTYSGIHMNPLDPKPDDFRIEDIAHALPLICRGNGHVKTFFSVGQHCINCAREAEALYLPDRMVLACLLHDASECYMSDVPRPFKRNLPEYREAEDHLLSVLYTKFLGSDLTDAEYRRMKQIDNAMFWYDMHELLNEDIGPKPEIHIRISYAWRPFREVEKEYLDIYRTRNRSMIASSTALTKNGFISKTERKQKRQLWSYGTRGMDAEN